MTRNTLAAILALALLLGVGCATQIPPSERIIRAIAVAHPPIGRVVPVFVAISCENCVHGVSVAEPFVERKNVYAQNSAGQYVQPLSVDDVERDAGRPEQLASLLTHVTDDQALDAYETEINRGSGLVIIASGACPSDWGHLLMHLPSAPSVERAKLKAIALQESDPAIDGPICQQLNYNNGWVFFPIGNYKQLRLDISEFGKRDLLGLGPNVVVFKELKLPWIERQGIPEGNYPTLRGTD